MATAIAALFSLASAGQAAPASNSLKVQRDGTMSIAGRSLRCGNVRNVLDGGLPSEGAAAPGVLVINPRLLNRMPPTVRIFVYYHECGHHSVGASELGADSWAVNRGVSEGWLDRSGLQQVCRSFGNMPRTPTHPSSRSRCRNLERVYAKALASKAPLPSRKPVEQANAVNPTLVSGPKLIGAGSTEPGKTASSRRRPANRAAH